VNNGAVLNAAGRVLMDSTNAAPATYNAGLAYSATGAIKITGSNPDLHNAGWAVGGVPQALKVITSEVAVPVQFNAGKGMQFQGAMIVNETLPIARYVSGWPMAANGTVCAAITAAATNAFSNGFDTGFD